MTSSDIIRSWIDPEYRASLGADAPAHPAGVSLLDDADLLAAGGTEESPPAEEECPAEEAGKTFFWSNRHSCIKCPWPSKPS